MKQRKQESRHGPCLLVVRRLSLALSDDAEELFLALGNRRLPVGAVPCNEKKKRSETIRFKNKQHFFNFAGMYSSSTSLGGSYSRASFLSDKKRRDGGDGQDRGREAGAHLALA